VAVRRPHHRGEVGDQERVDDGVELGQVARADLDLHPLARHGDVARDRMRVLGADPRPRVDGLAPVLDGAQHEPRRVVAADALEAVLDLAAELGVHDRHHVQHTRRHERVVGVMMLGDDPPQGGLDLRRRRVALRPDLVH
jgi:hypothetical protein